MSQVGVTAVNGRGRPVSQVTVPARSRRVDG